MAAGIPAPTLPGQAAFEKPCVFVALARKTRLPSCRRQGPGLSIPGKNGGYYIASRNFELPELKLLIDAVQSSRFLTEKKSRELIEKLCRECSV